jgi:hypothetical protein
MLKLTPYQFGTIFESLRTSGTAGGSEKRQATRMDVQTRISLASLSGGKVGRCYTGLTRDISASGMGFFQYAAFNNGDTFLVSFPFGKDELVLQAQSMFCRPMADGMFGIGAQFDAMATPALVEQLKSARATATVDRIRQSILT